MRSLHRGLLVLFAIAVAVALVVQLQQPAPAAIRVGYLPISADLDFFVAVDQGFFNQSGLQIEPVRFGKSNDLVSAVGAGNIDASAPAGIEVVFNAHARSPGNFKIVQAALSTRNTSTTRLVVLNNSPITLLEQVEGKRVGIMTGTNHKTLFRLALQKRINVSTITFVELATELQLNALQAGSIDALVSLEPIGTLAERKLGARLVESNFIATGLFTPMPNAAALVSTRLERENPAAARAYAKALANAAEFSRENPVEAKRSFAKWIKLDEGTAVATGEYPYAPYYALDDANLQRMADLLFENRILEKQVDARELYY
ncbi:MAG: ABC transporter substrate-binding protein, partial [Candidatus Micrarchaeota archaeon]